MRRVLIGAVVAALGATAVAAALAVGAIGGSGGGAEAAAEGIQVHGHWTIEVRDADGTVAERREFENALSRFGEEHLTKLLARTRTQGTWSVFIGDETFPSRFGIIGEAGGLAVNEEDLDGMSRVETLVLEGSVQANQTGDITRVRTFTSSAEFTARALPSAIPVQQGQQILVRVEIGFS